MRKGISLLTLVTTICVTLLLSAVVISTALKETPVNKAAESRFKTDLKNCDEEIKMAISKEYLNDKTILSKVIVDIDEIAKYSKNAATIDYKDLIFISNGELTLYGSKLTDEQRVWATEANLKISDIAIETGVVIGEINPTTWTNSDVVISLSYIDLPTGYVLQFKELGSETWTTSDKVAVVDNCTIVARIYNEQLDDAKGITNIIVDNIDKNGPSHPTDIVIESVSNSKSKITASGSVDDFSDVVGYVYSVDKNFWSGLIPAGESYEINGLEYFNKSKPIYVKAVDGAGNYSEIANSLSSALGITTPVDITPTETTWQKYKVTVEVSYPDEIPENYEIQYKIGTGPWLNGTTAQVKENAVVYGRLYNKNLDDAVAMNEIEITNIDTEVPTMPTDIIINRYADSINVLAMGSQDDESGLAGYIYSIDGSNWTRVIAPGVSYTFESIRVALIRDVYAKAVDNMGNVSPQLKKQ